jgi:hypothetical protein
MEKINEKSKIVLDKLWEYASKNNGYYKLNNDPTYMSLTIEILCNNQISLCHYGEQNGDLMRDPEMVFWKDENNNYFPFYFRNDYVGFEEFSGEIIDNKLVINNAEQQEDQIEFTNIWMENIKHQQGIM